MNNINKILKVASRLKTIKLADSYILQFLLRPVFLIYIKNKSDFNIRDFRFYLETYFAEILGELLDNDFASIMNEYNLKTNDIDFSYRKYLSDDKYGFKYELLNDYLKIVYHLNSEQSPNASGIDVFNSILKELSILQKNNEYMPSGISELIKGILNQECVNQSEIYSPCIGYGDLVKISAANKDIDIYGQDISAGSIQISLMNLILNGFRNINLRIGNTLTNPQFTNNKYELNKFKTIVASLPHIRNWYEQENSSETLEFDPKNDPYNRFNNIPVLSSRSDTAFLYTILFSLAENGVAIIVLNSSFMNRGVDLSARKDLLENHNVIHAIITLGKKLRIDTLHQYSIIVLKKGRNKNDNILYIDASNSPSATRRAPLHRELNLDTIADIHNSYKSKSTLSEEESVLFNKKYISIEKIRNNGYSLVFNKDEIPKSFDIQTIDVELTSKRLELARLTEKLNTLFNELNINGIY